VEKWYWAEVEKRTNGRVKIEMHWAGELTKGLETLPMLKSGAVDISDPPASYFPAQLPLISLFNGTRIPTDYRTIGWASYQIFHCEGEISKALHDEIKKHNIKRLLWIPLEYRFISRVPIGTLADMKGKKFRAIGIYEPPQKKSFGAIPVNVMPGEWYDAMNRGTVDAFSCVWDMVPAFKLQEVSKYTSFSDGGILGASPHINLNSWNKLPDDIKNVMNTVTRESVNKMITMYGGELKKADKIIIKDAGVKLLDVDPKEQEMLQEAWVKTAIDNWLPFVEKKGHKGIGRKILNRWLELTRGNGLDYFEKKFSK
ncbi:MAG: TRAP transporter substrate-binding protein DctP, partial [Pseudomonadota bacterium]